MAGVDRGQAALPPYVSYRTFAGYLELLRDEGLPARICYLGFGQRKAVVVRFQKKTRALEE